MPGRHLLIACANQCLVAVLLAAPSQAAVFNIFGVGQRAAFEAAAGGGPFLTQDFNGFAHNTDLDGVEFLPGISVTSNMDDVVAFDPSSTGDRTLFALDDVIRQIGGAFYDINFGQPYLAVGFDIDAFDPNSPGPGVMEFFFSDATSNSVQIFPTNATENDPVFFGIISNTPIDRLRWSEGPEVGGTGNEETGLDNFVTPGPVPEPATLVFAAIAAIGAGLVPHRRRCKA